MIKRMDDTWFIIFFGTCYGISFICFGFSWGDVFLVVLGVFLILIVITNLVVKARTKRF